MTSLEYLTDTAAADLRLLHLEPGERLWKLFCFKPQSGRATRLEHHIYTKLKANGRLALVTFAVHRPNGSQPVRSNIARVPDLSTADLEHIIGAVRRETPGDECDELDLSDVDTLDEQMARFGGRAGQKDTPSPTK